MVIALIMSSIEGKLSFTNNRISPSPATVGAESTIKLGNIRSSLVGTFEIGDCFIFEVAPIDDYIEMGDALDPPKDVLEIYKPFPTDSIACDFTPAATCIKDDSEYKIRITLLESAGSVSGEFGTMKNPFSSVEMQFERLKYYQQCGQILSTEKDSSGRLASFKFRQAAIDADAVQFTVAKTIIGAADIQNTATFKFRPATSLPENGGQFALDFPTWYQTKGVTEDGYDAIYDQYSFGGENFNCESPNIAAGLDQGSDSKDSSGDGMVIRNEQKWVIYFTEIAGSGSDEVTIICKGFRNPITPVVVSGYSITIQDSLGNMIDRTFPFSLDASAFTPFDMPFGNIVYTVGDSKV